MVAALILTSCSRAPGTPTTETPLAELESLARRVVETDAIDFGTAPARLLLGRGWGPDEVTPTGESFAWGLGSASVVRLDVIAPRDRRVILHGTPFLASDEPGNTVELRLNGRKLGRADLLAREGRVRFDIDQGEWWIGENELEIRYTHAALEEALPYAVAWRDLRMTDGTHRAHDVPAPTFERSRLRLPARTGLEWTLALKGDAELAWSAVGISNGAIAELTIRTKEGSKTRRLRSSAAGSIALPTNPGEPCEFLLTNAGSAGTVEFDGVVLRSVGDVEDPGSESAAIPVAGAPPNLILYLIDTLRPDHLGVYGYTRATSPEIDRFASGAVRWTQARSPAPWTRPSVATLVTGLLPIEHGVEEVDDGLPHDLGTIAEWLRASGYQTASLTTNGSVGSRFGFARGWDYFAFLSRPTAGRAREHLPSADVNTAVLEWLDRRDPSRPFLLFVHTFDPHDPYLPQEPFRSRFAEGVDPALGCCEALAELADLEPAEASRRLPALQALYDGEVAQNDAAFGAFLRSLEDRGLLDSSAVILVSDHGEEFLEHGGWRHGSTLFDEQLRVPFLVRLPGGRHGGEVVDAPVGLIDVVPTLLALAGAKAPVAFPGRSVLDTIGHAHEDDRPQFSWLKRGGVAYESVVRGGWKLIQSRGAPPRLDYGPGMLFDLRGDPVERIDESRDRPLRRRLLASLLRWRSALPAASAQRKVVLDEELRETLRALGYL